MINGFLKNPVALAAVAALGSLSAVTLPQLANAQKVPGTYAAGDFHNHSTCSDGAVSLQKKVDGATRNVVVSWDSATNARLVNEALVRGARVQFAESELPVARFSYV